MIVAYEEGDLRMAAVGDNGLQMSPSLISEQNGWNLEMFGATRQFWPKLKGNHRNIKSLHIFVSRFARPLPCNPLKTLKTTKNILGPAWKCLDSQGFLALEETRSAWSRTD
jgi:hypothetical protein